MAVFGDSGKLTAHLLDLFSFDFNHSSQTEQGVKHAFDRLYKGGIVDDVQADIILETVMEQSDPLKRARAAVIEYLASVYGGNVKKYGSDVISVCPELCEEVGVRLFRSGSDKVQMDVLRHLSWDARSCLPRQRRILIKTFDGLMDAASRWKDDNCSRREVEQDLEYITAKSNWVWFDDLYNAQVKVDFAPKSPDVYIWSRLVS